MPEFPQTIPIGGSGFAGELAVLMQLVVAFLFGCMAAAIHYLTSASARNGNRSMFASAVNYVTSASARGSDRSLHATLVLLAVLIAVVTIVVGGNIARAFSLAGVLAIVRFRTVVDDTRDTAFVIYAVVAGMAVGGGYYWEPVLVTPLVFLAAWLFRPTPNATPPSHGVLIVRLTAGRPIDSSLEVLLNRHVQGYHLVGMSTARGGSALDATYSIPFPAADKIFNLIAELGRLEGVQGVEVKEN
ncbi:MAG: DUF4956 domain-containing protein [Planctomycetota bacterium]|jgi:hypothetical protein